MQLRIMSGIVSAFLLVSSPVIASDTQWFVGAGIGYQDDNVRHGSNAEDTSFQLRGGAILDENHRLMATYGYMDKHRQHMGLVSYDYLYPLRDNFLIHGGASLGSSSTEISNKRSNDPVWGGQLGVIYRLDEHISTEVTYRYLDQHYNESGKQVTDTQQILWLVDFRF